MEEGIRNNTNNNNRNINNNNNSDESDFLREQRLIYESLQKEKEEQIGRRSPLGRALDEGKITVDEYRKGKEEIFQENIEIVGKLEQEDSNVKKFLEGVVDIKRREQGVSSGSNLGLASSSSVSYGYLSSFLFGLQAANNAGSSTGVLLGLHEGETALDLQDILDILYNINPEQTKSWLNRRALQDPKFLEAKARIMEEGRVMEELIKEEETQSSKTLVQFFEGVWNSITINGKKVIIGVGILVSVYVIATFIGPINFRYNSVNEIVVDKEVSPQVVVQEAIRPDIEVRINFWSNFLDKVSEFINKRFPPDSSNGKFE